jgi:hypothetical protein
MSEPDLVAEADAIFHAHLTADTATAIQANKDLSVFLAHPDSPLIFLELLTRSEEAAIQRCALRMVPSAIRAHLPEYAHPASQHMLVSALFETFATAATLDVLYGSWLIITIVSEFNFDSSGIQARFPAILANPALYVQSVMICNAVLEHHPEMDLTNVPDSLLAQFSDRIAEILPVDFKLFVTTRILILLDLWEEGLCL